MDKIFLRAYTKTKKPKEYNPNKEKYKEHKVVFVFDTETETNVRQSLKVGYFQVYVDESLVHNGLFYKSITDEEKDILNDYGRKNHIQTYSLNEFIHKVFYPLMLKEEVLCLGFNLPFDLARISQKYGLARNSEYGGFSFSLSENEAFPRIKIYQLNSDTNIIKFSYSKFNRKGFQGNFLDVQRLASILLEKKRISLKDACKELKTKTQKLDVEEHGKITNEYLDYLFTDVRATYEVYLKLKEEFEKYGIDTAITKTYSGASLGKSALNQMGIKPFLERNPDFPDWLLGNIMSGYYGGRTECNFRKKPVKVSTLDFTSTYPTIALIMNLWNFIIADKIDYKECTKEIQELLNNITLKDLLNKEIWDKFCVLVEIEPNGDILPTRTIHDNKSKIPTISISKIFYNGKLYYFLLDIIASKLLSNKTPKIKNAIRFIPVGKQETLRETNILGTQFNPNKENFIEKLVEERQRIKEINPSKAQSFKLIGNTVAYGIYIQVDRDENKEEIDVFSNKQFSSEASFEKQGEFFNPLVATSITSGARLLLAMAEKYVIDLGYSHYYMDSDSIFVPPEIADSLSNFFDSLSPYGKNVKIFKIEKRNKWFCGISSKRYVLYDIKRGKIIINPNPEQKEYKLHGLGYLLNPFGKEIKHWQVKIWEDILKLEYGKMSEEELISKYSKFFAISQQTISNYHSLDWFKKNKDIQPYNFFLRGIGGKSGIKPITAFTKDTQSVVYEPFIDMDTGKFMQGQEYWKPLDEEIISYLNHAESKFENGNNVGLMKRRVINPLKVVYIGKESNKIENSELMNLDKHEQFVNYKEARKKILKMSFKEAHKRGVSKSTLWEMKDRLRKNPKKFNWRTIAVNKLLD